MPDQEWFRSFALKLADEKTRGNVDPLFRCPVGDASGKLIPYIYTPTPPGRDPRIGEVLVSCPIHHYKIVWTKDMQDRLERLRPHARLILERLRRSQARRKAAH